MIPPGWPTGDQITQAFQLHAAALKALTEVTADDMLAVLQKMPPGQRQFVVHSIGLHAVGSVNRGMAGQLLAQLHRQDNIGSSALLRGIVLPVVTLFDTDELSAKEWAALGADSSELGLYTLAAHEDFARHLADVLANIPPSLLRAGLVAAIAANTVNAPVALAYLARDDEDAQKVRVALRSEFPDVPEVPALPLAAAGPVSRLIGAGLLPPRTGQGSEQIVDLLKSVADSGDVPREIDDRSEGLVEDATSNPAGVAKALLDDWDSVSRKLTALAAGMHDGVPPAGEDLKRILSFVDAVDAVLDAADDLVEGDDELGVSRDSLARAAQLLIAAEDPSEKDDAWLDEFAELAAPIALNNAAELVRTLAERAAMGGTDAGMLAGLRGLHTLIGLTAARRAGEPVDYEALAAAQADAQTHLPAEVRPLVAAAALADVTLPKTASSAAQARKPGSGTRSASLPADSDSSEHEADRIAEPTDQAAAQASEQVESGSGMTDATGARDSSAERTPAGVATEPETTNLDEDPLADLDAMLADGAAASLAVATGARRTTIDERVPISAPEPCADEVTVRPSDAVPDQQKVTESDLAASEVEAAMVGEGRFGLAADLREALGGTEPQVAARQLAAYAVDLRQATGPLAAAFARAATLLTRESLADDHTGQLLTWAAAVRIALLAPSAGAAGLIAEFTPCVSHHPALADLGKAFAEASRTGLIVLPGAASAVEALSAAETSAADMARVAAETLSLARQRSIKYTPANRVYQIWMNSDGPLGELLGTVAENKPECLAAVRDKVIDLRGQAEKSIADIFAQRRRNPHAKIVGGAHATLVNRWNEAIELASSWAETAERASDRANRLYSVRRQTGPLAMLRARVREVREGALDALSAMATQLIGGAEGARRLVADALNVCDGQPPTGDDVDSAFAAHGELMATTLPLFPATLRSEAGLSETEVEALIAVAQDMPDWANVYAARAAAGDHDLTAVLIAALQHIQPRLAASLQLRRDADVAETGSEIAEQVRERQSLVDARRLAGALSDDRWSSLSARLAALDAPNRRDFGQMSRELAEITEALDAELAARTQQTVARIEALAAESPVVAEAAETFVQLARRGQIASAEEYLEQARSGGTLPTLGAGTDHLSRFYPAVPELIASHPDLIAQLRAVLHNEPPSAPVGRLSEIVGVDVMTLPQPRRDLGELALRGWRSLEGRPDKGTQLDVTTALRAILGQAGLEFGELETHRPVPGQAGRQWITLGQVTGTGNALHPALGSAMGPGGDSLRVLLIRKAASPATIVEWMNGEPSDRSVLALWLAGPLSTADRRAIADAARGRPRPPLLLLDAAALAYLTCQREPRRSTFAEISLPFTAMSPYRDTAGDVAPEMFYGRIDEMAAVLDLEGSSIVYGGRQLGKSALLRAAERRFRGEGLARTAVFTSIFTVGADGHPERLWSTLWPKLATHGAVDGVPPADGDLAEAVHTGVLAWLAADPRRALLILLDEADAFLDADASGNRFTNVDWCRRIREDSNYRVKFVFAGLHRTARFESLRNQPLSHFGRPVSVGPLRAQHAYDLLTRPLAALGFHFADETAIPARILALTNNMPALLQLFGSALVAHLISRPVGSGEPPGLVTDADVDEVLANADLFDAFREKYVLTLNLDHRYLVIAYAVAQSAFEHGIDTSVSFSELATVCRQAWPQGFASCGADELRGLVTECVDLGILATDAGHYRMRTPMVLRLLGTEEEVFEALYSVPERLSLPSITDPGSYRRHLPGTTARSPLTEAQLGRIFGARAGVSVVAGSAALGVERVRAAIDEAYSEGARRFGQLQHARTLTPDGLRRTIEMLTGSRALVVADARNVKTEMLRDLLWTAVDAVGVAELSNVAASVVLIAGPTNAAGWVNRDDLIELSRIDPGGLRLWCDEDGLPYPDDQARIELLAATGGWPRLVTRLAESQRGTGPVASGAKALTELSAWISGPGAHEFADAAGVGTGGGVLAKAFATAASLTSGTGADTEYLGELLALDDSCDLVDDALSAGYKSLGEVVAAMSVLGCLTVGPDGMLHAEPVLAAAVATAGAM